MGYKLSFGVPCPRVVSCASAIRLWIALRVMELEGYAWWP